MNNPSRPAFNYAEFEASFRGSREEVKDKLTIYLPLIHKIAPDSEHPCLDIACGRGEWLELLKKEGYPATGIDINPEFVESCKKNGLRVEQTDLFEFLKRQGEQRYKLITGFHIIEHITFEQQQLLLQQVLSLLAPDGLLILETPNPENVTVGSCNFYIDPTHIRPVPPQLLLFLAQQANFGYPLIAKVNRFSSDNKLRFMQDPSPEVNRYNKFVEFVSSRLFQAPDYALIAFKDKKPDKLLLQEVTDINQKNEAFEAPADTLDDLRALLWGRDLKILDLNEKLQKAYADLHASKNELASVYNTAAGQFIRQYKSFKRKLKAKKSSKENNDSDTPELPKTVRKVYDQLRDAFDNSNNQHP